MHSVLTDTEVRLLNSILYPWEQDAVFVSDSTESRLPESDSPKSAEPKSAEPDPSILYGYDSPENSYLVDDYPYGFRLRTEIRYWQEYKPGKGFRFVSQTLNPKTGRWNEPKASTYSRLAMQMFLDENDHVKYANLTEYDDANAIERFVNRFSEANMHELRPFVLAKSVYVRRHTDFYKPEEIQKWQELAGRLR